HIEMWGDEGRPKCSITGCIDYSLIRGMCKKHYEATREKGISEGTWQPRTLRTETPCSTEGCESMAEENGSGGRRYSYLPVHLQATAPRCKEPDCGEPARSLGRCRIHDYQWRRANAKTCVIDGCDKKGNRSKGLCSYHWTEEKKA